MHSCCSNNTNKLSPQEHLKVVDAIENVQIIQINLALKNEELRQAMTWEFK